MATATKPQACAVCGAARVTRHVRDRYYCTEHKAEAFDDARRASTAALSGGPTASWGDPTRRQRQNHAFDSTYHYNI